MAPSPFYSNTNVHLVDINVFAKFDGIPSLPVQVIKENQNVVNKELQRAVTLKELAPSLYFSIINVHLVDIKEFAKSDEIPSLTVQVYQEKTKMSPIKNYKGQNSKRIDHSPYFSAITLKELAPSPYFSIINVHLVNINVSAKFYGIPSLPFQDVEKRKHRRLTNGQRENSIPTTNTVCSLQRV